MDLIKAQFELIHFHIRHTSSTKNVIRPMLGEHYYLDDNEWEALTK